MKVPLYQRIWLDFLSPAIGGAAVLGIILDAINNTISIVTPLAAWKAIAGLLIGLFCVSIFLGKRLISWKLKRGPLIRPTRLGIRVLSGFVGMVLLLLVSPLYQWTYKGTTSQPANVGNSVDQAEAKPIKQDLSLPSNTVLVLIADFDGLNPQEYGVTQIIYDQLGEISKKYNDVQINCIHEVIDSSDTAQAKARELKAAIVIWGNYLINKSHARVTVYFTVLNEPHYLPLRSEKETLKMPAAELGSFGIQERVSKEMSYLTLLVNGLTRYVAQDYAEAIKRFDDALALPRVPEQMVDAAIAYFYRGTAHSFNGNYDRAIADLNRVVKLNPKLAIAYNNLGITYSQQGNYGKAVANYKQSIKIKKDHAPAYANLGGEYLDKGKYDLAIVELSKAIEYQPDLMIAHFGLGKANYFKGDYDQAIKNFEATIKLGENAEAYSFLGLSYCGEDDYSQGIFSLEKAIEINPNSAVIHSNLGRAYSEKGDYEQAIVNYNKAIELSPEAEFYHDRGITNYAKGDCNQAINDFKRAIEINADFADAYYGLSYAYLNLAQGDSAAAAAQAYLRLKGWRDKESQFMALVSHFGYQQAGRITDAQRIIYQANTRCDNSAWPYPIIKYLRHKITLQDLLEIINVYEIREVGPHRSLTLGPNKSMNTVARAYIGMALSQLADTDQALIYLQWVKKNGSKRSYEYQLALSEIRRIEISRAGSAKVGT